MFQDYNVKTELMASLPRPKMPGLKKKDYALVMQIAKEKKRLKVAETSVHGLSAQDQQEMLAKLEYKSKQVANSGCFPKRMATDNDGFQQITFENTLKGQSLDFTDPAAQAGTQSNHSILPLLQGLSASGDREQTPKEIVAPSQR